MQIIGNKISQNKELSLLTFVDIKMIIKKYCNLLSTHKIGNIDEIDQIFDTRYKNSHKQKNKIDQ
jgi:hypothetical protein